MAKQIVKYTLLGLVAGAVADLNGLLGGINISVASVWAPDWITYILVGGLTGATYGLVRTDLRAGRVANYLSWTCSYALGLMVLVVPAYFKEGVSVFGTWLFASVALGVLSAGVFRAIHSEAELNP